MPVHCFGLNHEVAALDLRERVALSESGAREALNTLTDSPLIAEAVILATCNRMEIYAVAADRAEPAAIFGHLESWLTGRFSLSAEEAGAFYRLSHRESVRHLFSVAAGLNSMVLGETEIFGQVKKAYALAQDAGATARTLNKLFQKSFQVGKQVRTHTDITRGATSVGGVGVELAEKIFGDLKDCQILILGAGEMSQRTAQSLQSRGVSAVLVSNRSYDRAVELAASMNGRAIRFDDWHVELPKVDIIISSTAAPHHVVTRERLQPHLRHRSGRPLFLIDLSVPRDVEPSVGQLDEVYLYDLDTLQQLAETAKSRRREQIAVCERLIDECVSEFLGSGVLHLNANAPRQSNPLTAP